jgi:hypothetical protein
MRLLYKIPLAILVLFIVLSLGWCVTHQPRSDREWRPDVAYQATTQIEGDMLTISHVRDSVYRSTEDFDVRWSEQAYNLSGIVGVWFYVEPFAEWEGMAHTLYSFEFEDGRFVTLSVEARKEVGEPYSVVRGLTRRLELVYIFATEEDVVRLRAIHRNHSIYQYSIKTTKENARLILEDVAARANSLAEDPEFYNSITSTCTTNVVDHINTIVPGRVPKWSYKVLAPGYSDSLAYELGLIDTDAPLDEIRARYNVQDRVKSWDATGSFSAWIRGR